MTLRVLSLFAGIGGFDLGLERTGGFRTVAFCEIEPYCQRVLRKHWPEVPIYDDVRELTGERLRADGIAVDVICGGFPCQDISFAGKGAGIEGERSGLWSEYARLIGEIRPRYVIVENVAALLTRGLQRVLGDLAALGFDAEWHCIPASAVGAPHRRDRLWIVADAERSERGTQHQPCGYLQRPDGVPQGQQGPGWARGCGEDVANADQPRLSFPWAQSAGEDGRNPGRVLATSDWWSTEPDVGRVAHGVPSRVDRLRALGNAVVPQIPELIGHAILRSLEERRAAA